MSTFVVYYPKHAPEIRSFKDKKFLLDKFIKKDKDYVFKNNDLLLEKHSYIFDNPNEWIVLLRIESEEQLERELDEVLLMKDIIE